MSGAASALRSLSLALSSFITISLCVSRPSCLFDPISDMATLSNSLTLGCPTGRQAQRSHVAGAVSFTLMNSRFLYEI